MKNSGIMWFPYIPQNWSIKKLNHICTVITDYVASGSFADLAANVEYLDEPNYAMLIRTTDISDKGHNSKPVYISEKSYQFLSNSNLFGGEILLPNIGASVGDVYIVPRLYEKMSLAPNSIMLKTEYEDKFFYYFFFCDAGKKSLLNIAKSTAQPKFNKTDLRQLKVIVPPIDEQHRIADFLDRKCAEIDRVLEKTRASIDEYKKLKQSVITQAVTKGIRGEREMKDSGIEWIGEIPREWEISLLKYSIKWKSVKGYGQETILSLYRDYGVVIKDSRDDNHNVTSLDTDTYKFVEIGDFVINKMKAWQGSMAVSNYNGIISPAYHVCQIINPNVFKRYFHHLMRNQLYIPEYTRLSTGMRIGQWDLSFDDFRNLPFIIPPMDEQIEIADYIDRKCAEIDTLISKKEQLITELEAYKKSLIYEYVTGKKEVQ